MPRLNPTDPLFFVVQIVSVLICFLLAGFCLATGKSNINGGCGMDYVEQSRENFILLCFYILCFARTQLSQTILDEVIYKAIEDAMVLVIWVYFMLGQSYWDLRVNQFYAAGIGAVGVTKAILNSGTVMLGTSDYNATLLTVIPPLAAGLSYRILEKWGFFDFINGKLTHEQLLYSMVMYEELSRKLKENHTNLQGYERSLLTYYTGIVESHSLKCKYLGCYCKEHDASRSTSDYLICLLKQRCIRNKKYLLALLYFLINNYFYGLVYFRTYLLSLKAASSENILSKYRIFRLRSLFETYTECVSHEKTDQKNISQSTFTFMKELLQTKQQEKSVDSLDFCDILTVKNEYLKMVKQCEKMIGLKTSIFQTLLGDTKVVKIIGFLNTNRNVIKLNSAIKSRISFILKTYSSLVPTYFYAMIMVYYQNVRNEVKLSSDLYKTYKKKLLRWKTLYQTKENLTKHNLLLQCVIFRVSIERGKAGTILDYSPDYYSYLGEMETKNLAGYDINLLLPDSMQNDHRAMMQNMHNLNTVINQKRTFFVTGFDRMLRNVDIFLKLHTSIDQDASAYIYIRVKDTNNSCVVLADDKGRIISASKIFWDIIDNFNPASSNIASIEHVSPKMLDNAKYIIETNELARNIKNSSDVMNFISTRQEDQEFSLYLADEAKYSERIKSSNPKIVLFNDSYVIDKSSELFIGMGGSKMSTEMTTHSFADHKLVEILINFDPRFYEESQSKSNSNKSVNSEDSSIESSEVSEESEESEKSFEVDAQHKLNKIYIVGAHRHEITRIEVYQSPERINMEESEEKKNKPLSSDSVVSNNEHYESDEPIHDLLRIRGPFIFKTTSSGCSNLKDPNEAFFEDEVRRELSDIQEMPIEREDSDISKQKQALRSVDSFQIVANPINTHKNKKTKTYISKMMRRASKQLAPGGGFKEKSAGSKFFDLVNLKQADERQRIRRIQRTRHRMSVVLASSKFINVMLQNFDKEGKAQEKKIRAMGFTEDIEGNSVSSFYRINLNGTIDRAFEMPKRISLQFVMIIILVLYLTDFLMSIGFFYYIMQPISLSLGYLQLLNKMIGNIDLNSRILVTNYIELVGTVTQPINLGYSTLGFNQTLDSFCRRELKSTLTIINQLLNSLIITADSPWQKLDLPTVDQFTLAFIRSPILISNLGSESTRESNLFSILSLVISQVNNLLKLFKGDGGVSASTEFENIREFIFKNIPGTFLKTISSFQTFMHGEFANEIWRMYSTYFYEFMLLYTITLFAIYASFLVTLKLFNDELNNAVGGYSVIKQEEALFNLKALEQYRKVIVETKFHEEKLMNNFLGNATILAEIKSSQSLKSAKSKSKSSNNVFIKEYKPATFPSVSKTMVFGTFVMMLFLLLAVLIIYNRSQISKQMELLFLEKQVIDNFHTHSNAVMAVLFNLKYGIAYALPQGAANQDLFKISQDYPDYFSGVIGSSSQLKELVGDKAYERVYRLLREDICAEYVLVSNESLIACNEFNAGIAKTGFVNYLYFEQDYLKRIQDEINSWRIANNNLDEPSPYLFNKYWDSAEFVQIRLSHSLLIPHYLTSIFSLLMGIDSDADANYRSMYLQYLLIFFAIVVSVIIIFAISTYTLFSHDLTSSLETYRIIHPSLLVENAYILNRFKRYFEAPMISKV